MDLGRNSSGPARLRMPRRFGESPPADLLLGNPGLPREAGRGRNGVAVPGNMGSDNPKNRRAHRLPPRLVFGAIFCGGIIVGVLTTLLLADLVILDSEVKPELVQQQGSTRGARARDGQQRVTLELGQRKEVGLPSTGNSMPPSTLPQLNRGTLSREDVWIETISELPGPRIYIIHNVVTYEERQHLKSLGVLAGMEHVYM